MDSLRVDTTYGGALFEVAKDAGKVQEILEDLKALSSVFVDNPDFDKFLMVPTISVTEKKRVVKEIFSGKVEKETLNFLRILIEKRRLGAWEGIVKQYEIMVDEGNGKTKGVVYSVVPLTEENILKLEEEIEKMLSKKVKLENRIDDTLIGGVVVYVDGMLIDVSIKKRLDDLKKAMFR